MIKELQQDDIVKLFNTVSATINDPRVKQEMDAIKHTRKFGEILAERALETAYEYFNNAKNEPCKTEYEPLSWEYIILALTLLSEAWISEILRLKTKDGHCWTHKQETGFPPCPIGSQFHKRLREECIADLENVLELIKSMPVKIVAKNK